MPGREPSIQKPEDRWNWSTNEEFQTREEAMKREYAIKQLSRKKRGTDQDQASLKVLY